jgi:uncharacterized membrane protein HdeD (DUF308 family)
VVTEVVVGCPSTDVDDHTPVPRDSGRTNLVIEDYPVRPQRWHARNLPVCPFGSLRAMVTEQTPERIINYAFLLGGVTALIFGAILLIRQEAALGVVALLLGLWWLIQGAFVLFSVLIDRSDAVWKIIVGVIGLTAGIVVLANPVQTGQFLGSALAIVLGVTGILIAIVAILGGFRGGGFASLLFGVVSGSIGLLLLLYPEGSFTTMVTIVGIILVVQGIVAIFLAGTSR